MEEKQLLKQITDTSKQIEVRYFISKENMIPQAVKEQIKGSIRELLSAELDDCTISHKIDKDFYVRLNKRWSITFDFYEIKEAKNLTYDQYHYKGVYYEDLSNVKKNKLFDEVVKLFQLYDDDISSIGNNVNDMNYMMMNCHYQGSKSYRSDEQVTDVSLSKELKEKFLEAFEVIPIMVEFYQKRTRPLQSFYYVHSVIQGDRARWALIFGGRYNTYKIAWFHEDSDIYNYIDTNRTLFVKDNYDFNWIAFDVTTEKEVETYPSIFADYTKYIATLSRTSRDEYGDYNEDMWNTFVDNKSLVSARTTFLLAEKKRDREKAIINQKNKTWEEALTKLDKKPLEKNGINFGMHSMEYEGIKVDTHGNYNFGSYLREVGVDSIADFNAIFTRAITSVVNTWLWRGNKYDMSWQIRNDTDSRATESKVSSLAKLPFTIDGKKIIITQKDTFFYINDIRINKLELGETITHSLCYQKLADYTKFLESVNKCNLKFHNAIVNGVKKSFQLNGDYITIELKLERKKNLNYIVSGKNRFRIKDSNRLLNNVNINYEQMIYLLLSITELKIEDMKGVIGDAKARYEEAIKKADELFKKTCKMFKVNKETIDRKDGWAVKGKSGNKYLIVEKGNNDYGIYRVSGGNLNYICIVDKSRKNQIGKDKLVSRIYALANDSLISDQIHTLKGRV